MWEPKNTNDRIRGRLLYYHWKKNKYGDYRVVAIQTGRFWKRTEIVPLYHKTLNQEFTNKNPIIGSVVEIVYLGKTVTKDLERYYYRYQLHIV